MQYANNPKELELDICVYLAGDRVGDLNNGGAKGAKNLDWDSGRHVSPNTQTYRISGFWKDAVGGRHPWYGAVLEKRDADTWNGTFFHRQPNIFNDNCGDLHISVK
ncbi:hypothetical protein [Fimbriiglobus ruber]|uniref:hypothetical protein n=1 Tax=Fimbriiglobus ruber TaxID=1908690 RepID=UPI00117AD8BE|nr:hypothetical protein [Fimbriiglobus ruber]